MNSEHDGIWENLGADWRGNDPDKVPTASDIRRRIRRRRSRLAWIWMTDIILAVALMALVIHELIQDPGTSSWVLVVGMGGFIVVALAFSLVNRLGLWGPGEADLESYIREGIEHCRRRLRTVRFAWTLYAAEVIFIVGYGFGVGLSTGAWGVVAGTLAVFTIGLAAWSAWFRRRVLAERRYLEHIRAGDNGNS